MTPALWLVLGIVVAFLAYTLAVFLLPNDKDVDR